MQFKITLRDVKPVVWRRIQVPATYTFWDLHVAISDAMGWMDYHLHDFDLYRKGTPLKESLRVGIPDDEGWSIGDDRTIADWTVRLADWFPKQSKQVGYTYDFGDTWQHTVLFEKELPTVKGMTYPICLAGKNACPPEDCGGPWGYQDFKKVMSNSRHPEHQEKAEWYDDFNVAGFNPEFFDPKAVEFESPRRRLKDMLAHR